MKTIFSEAGDAQLREIPIPNPGPDEALIAVDASGLCGTDMLKLTEKQNGAKLGHEIAGRIEKISGKSADLKIGDRVIVGHHVPCGACHYCLRGYSPMCRQFKSTNIDPGGFSQFVRVSPLHLKHSVLKFPENLNPVIACQAEPLACCLRSIKRLGVSKGDFIGVIGLGTMGLLITQLLHRLGAHVLGLDLDEPRIKIAAPWAEGSSDPKLMEQKIASATSGRGLDALIFTAGPAAAVAEKMHWLRDGGTFNIFAGLKPPKVELDLKQFYHREIKLISSYSSSLEDLREALELIVSKKVDIEALTTKTYGLQEFNQALSDVKNRRVMKAVFLPSK